MKAFVTYELLDGIATITMDDGKANAMGLRMMQELNTALDRAQADKAVVVLTGRDRMFSGGFDLAVFGGDPEELFRMLEAGALLAERLLSFPRPVVAACTGHAVAMGAFLLLGADVRLGVDQGARFQLNEVQIGLPIPWFAVEVCRQRLAPAHLSLAIVSGEPYSPQQAVSAGFLDEIVPEESVRATARSRAERLLKLPAESFTATKLRLRRNAMDVLQEAIRRDISDWTALLRNRS